jgi:hypothetical protein
MKEVNDFVTDEWIKCINNEIRAKNIIDERNIEYLLRNSVEPPIIGEITKCKLRWRGIKSLVWDADFNLVGIDQRGKLIKINKDENRKLN